MSNIDPYAPPVADGAQAEAAYPVDYGDASQGQRFANMIVDAIAAYVLTFLGGIVIVLTGMRELVANPLGAQLVGLGIFAGYYLVCEGLTGRTLGKLVTGTRVVDESGQKPSFGKILGRTLSRFVPFEAFSFLGSAPRGWHDRWSGTRVARTRG